MQISLILDQIYGAHFCPAGMVNVAKSALFNLQSLHFAEHRS